MFSLFCLPFFVSHKIPAYEISLIDIYRFIVMILNNCQGHFYCRCYVALVGNRILGKYLCFILKVDGDVQSKIDIQGQNYLVYYFTGENKNNLNPYNISIHFYIREWCHLQHLEGGTCSISKNKLIPFNHTWAGPDISPIMMRYWKLKVFTCHEILLGLKLTTDHM